MFALVTMSRSYFKDNLTPDVQNTIHLYNNYEDAKNEIDEAVKGQLEFQPDHFRLMEHYGENAESVFDRCHISNPYWKFMNGRILYGAQVLETMRNYKTYVDRFIYEIEVK